MHNSLHMYVTNRC